MAYGSRPTSGGRVGSSSFAGPGRDGTAFSAYAGVRATSGRQAGPVKPKEFKFSFQDNERGAAHPPPHGAKTRPASAGPARAQPGSPHPPSPPREPFAAPPGAARGAGNGGAAGGGSPASRARRLVDAGGGTVASATISAGAHTDRDRDRHVAHSHAPGHATSRPSSAVKRPTSAVNSRTAAIYTSGPITGAHHRPASHRTGGLANERWGQTNHAGGVYHPHAPHAGSTGARSHTAHGASTSRPSSAVHHGASSARAGSGSSVAERGGTHTTAAARSGGGSGGGAASNDTSHRQSPALMHDAVSRLHQGMPSQGTTRYPYGGVRSSGVASAREARERGQHSPYSSGPAPRNGQAWSNTHAHAGTTHGSVSARVGSARGGPTTTSRPTSAAATRPTGHATGRPTSATYRPNPAADRPGSATDRASVTMVYRGGTSHGHAAGTNDRAPGVGSGSGSSSTAAASGATKTLTRTGAATERPGSAAPVKYSWRETPRSPEAPPAVERAARHEEGTHVEEEIGEEIEDDDLAAAANGRPFSAKPNPARPQTAAAPTVRSTSPGAAGGTRPFAGDSAENRSSQRRVQSAHAGGAGPRKTVAQPVMDIGSINDTGQLPGYLLGRVVGEGGFCKVRAGIHQVTGAKTAVKLIDKARLVEPNDRRRVGREIRVLKRLAQEYIIRLFDVVDSPTRIYMVMEYADGGSLLDYVRARKRLTEMEASRFFYQMCQALDYCHANMVVHRDVKLENLLLDANNNIKLIDFGLSAILAPGKRLRVHCGSPSYAAPEIVGRKVYDGPPVDVWSAGVVLFAMVTGYLPFHAHNNNKQELCQKILRGSFTLPDFVSHDAKELICAVLRVDPDKRATIQRCYDSRWLRAAAASTSRQPSPTTYPAAVSEGEFDHSRLDSLEAAGLDRARLEEHLRRADHNYYTAAYHLLAYRDSAAVAKDIGAEKEAASAAAAAAGTSSSVRGGASSSAERGHRTHRGHGHESDPRARAHSAHVSRGYGGVNGAGVGHHGGYHTHRQSGGGGGYAGGGGGGYGHVRPTSARYRAGGMHRPGSAAPGSGAMSAREGYRQYGW